MPQQRYGASIGVSYKKKVEEPKPQDKLPTNMDPKNLTTPPVDKKD